MTVPDLLTLSRGVLTGLIICPTTFTYIKNTAVTIASHFIVALTARLQCLVIMGVKLTSLLNFKVLWLCTRCSQSFLAVAPENELLFDFLFQIVTDCIPADS